MRTALNAGTVPVMAASLDVVELFSGWLSVRITNYPVLNYWDCRTPKFGSVAHDSAWPTMQEWRSEAAARGLKTQHMYGKAMRSLKEHTDSITCGNDATKVVPGQ